MRDGSEEKRPLSRKAKKPICRTQLARLYRLLNRKYRKLRARHDAHLNSLDKALEEALENDRLLRKKISPLFGLPSEISLIKNEISILRKSNDTLQTQVKLLISQHEDLILKLNRAKIKPFIEDGETGLSRVKAGHGASLDSVKTAYSSLISRMNRHLAKANDKWYESPDAKELGTALVREVVRHLDAELRASPALEKVLGDEGGSAATAENIIDSEQARSLIRLLTDLLTHMNSLEYWFLPAEAGQFPTILGQLNGQDMVIHDGSVMTALSNP